MTKFSDLNLGAKVLKAIAETGYDTPTPIQAGAIGPALEGRDVLGIAQTGTGKTAAFTLPMIALLGPWACTRADAALACAGSDPRVGRPSGRES